MASNSNKKIYVIAVLGLLAVGVLAWWLQNRPRALPSSGAGGAPMAAKGASGAAGGQSPGAGGPAAVEVGVVQTMALFDDAQAVGSLRSRQSVVLKPEVAGRVARIGFADGQRVRRGQLLVQFDDTLQQAQLAQAQAQASIARTNLQRSRELLAEGFVAKSVVDQNAAALEVAEAQVAVARAQVARMRMVAPFDALAGIRAVNVGDYLKDGAEIVGLEDLSSVLVDFRLPERYLARVRPQQVVELTVDALPGRRYQARVEAVDVQVDANGRAALLRARVDNPDAALRPGMFARARVVFQTRPQALVVPEEALVPQGEQQWLFKIEPDGKGGQQARRIAAQLGLRTAGKVELLAGVAAGDRVVTAGHGRLVRAAVAPVRVIELGAAGAAASGANAGQGNGRAAASAPGGGSAVIGSAAIGSAAIGGAAALAGAGSGAAAGSASRPAP